MNVEVRDGGVVKGNALNIESVPITGTTSYIPFGLRISLVEQASATLTITEHSVLADANTVVTLNSLRVYGLI